MILALVGLTAGQAVVWYTGQFYALFFLEKMLKVDGALTNTMVAAALLIGTPFFVFFGWLSDRIGRKPIILTGCLLAALTYFPLFHALTAAANPQPRRRHAQRSGDGDRRSRPTARSSSIRSARPCSTPPATWPSRTWPRPASPTPTGRAGRVVAPGARSATRRSPASTGDALPKAEFAARRDGLGSRAGAARWRPPAIPAKADRAQVNKPLVVGILAVLVLYVTMVYGPIAAMLVEMFPTRIRYTSMSLPYHIGNGWFGGFLPTTAFAMVAATGNIYYGLWYPVVVAAVTAVIGFLFIRETKDVDIDA